MKTVNNLSKSTIILLILINLIACKKDETVTAPPIVEKPCTISKINYGNGEYDEYKFNSSGQAIQEDGYTKDVDGK